MIILNFDEYNVHKKTIISELKKSVFVYPTDTIYGIGCDATNEKLVRKIRLLKKSDQPFSIIVPTKEWIYQNCIVTAEAEEWIRKLPGPYTLILRLKNKKAVARDVHQGTDENNYTIGIRMPNHWFLSVAFQAKLPIVTTSANITGQDFMTTLEDMDVVIRNNVDYIFYDGPKRGNLSTLVHLEGPKISIQLRQERKSSPGKIQFPLEEISITQK